MNRKTRPLISNDLRVLGSRSQCIRKSEWRLSMNREVVGQASRLPSGRLALETNAGETPAPAGGTPAPLPPPPGSWPLCASGFGGGR